MRCVLVQLYSIVAKIPTAAPKITSTPERLEFELLERVLGRDAKSAARHRQ